MYNIFGSKNKNDIDTAEPTQRKHQIKKPESSSSKNFPTIDQLKEFDDEDILLYIKKQLNIDSEDTIDVTGELYNASYDSYHYRIYNVKLKTGELLEYPISDLGKKDTIQENGIYVPYIFNKALKKYVNSGAKALVKCRLELSSTSERIKHENPLLLNVNPQSVQMLHEISETETIKDDNGNILVEDSVVSYYTELNKQKIKDSISSLNEKRIEVKEELQELIESSQEVVAKELKAIEKERDEIKTTILKLSSEYNSQQENIKGQEVKLEKLQTEIDLKQESKKQLQYKIDNLEDIEMKKLEKLRVYIKDKAKTLLDLEFIDKSEYNNLLMIKEESEDDEKFVDFSEDLNGDKQKAISHIQAYLFEQDIVYPRYILEDFFALIQTNDLIVLAGESGSGKTNLIKSFAKAVGGKSFIIPVKPNWTSSEDLLGYYNPLEKKYLSTPFLEALLEAKDNPGVPYFICLDEMNLARVEYYFADFLSLLEERGEQPEIKLYSEDESSHILSEFRNVMDTIEHVKEKYKKKNIVNFVKLLQDEEINRELTRIFGFSDKDSLIKYHTDLRRMLSGILNTPSSLVFPKNVRIIGAINIDETTHYLSPKILDRAHIMKFDSPLLQDWTKIANEIEDIENKELKIKINIEDLGTREPYPSFDREDEFCIAITHMTKKYFSPLGVEVGLRTIRQGLNYQKIFTEQGSNKELVMNNFTIHKILPKMTFDGKKKVGEITKNDLLLQFQEKLKEYIDQDLAKSQSIDAIDELKKIIKISKSNDGIVNYWA